MRSLLVRMMGLTALVVLLGAAILWVLARGSGSARPFLPPATFTRVAPAADEGALGALLNITVPASFTPAATAAFSDQPDGGLVLARPTGTATRDLAGYSTILGAGRTPTPTSRPTAIPSVTASITPTPAPTATRTQASPTSPLPGTAGPGSASRTPTSTPTRRPPTTAVPDGRSPKKGLAYIFPWPHPDDHEPFSISWYYDWLLYPGNVDDPQVEFVPLVPCGDTPASVVSVLGANYSGYLLFSNEPDRPDQCPATPAENARFYLDLRAALPQAKFVGPQVSHVPYNGSYTGYTEQWREAVRALSGAYPDVAGYGLHIYSDIRGAEDRVEAFCNKLAAWGELSTKELWVTEFGYSNFWGEPAFVRWQVRQMVTLFENGIGNCEVDRYAYYTNRETRPGSEPTPTVSPPGDGRPFYDLYWRNSYELSYTGQAYASVP